MRNTACIYCHQKDKVILRGKRKNKYAVKQQYWCRRCERYFVERDGFEGTTYPPNVIIKTLQLYSEGMSLSRIRDYVYQHKGYCIYDGTIQHWVEKYGDLLSQAERAVRPLIKKVKKTRHKQL